MLRTQLIAQLLSQLVTWWVMSDKEKVIGPCETTLPPFTTHYVTSCGKNCVRSCDSRNALYTFDPFDCTKIHDTWGVVAHEPVSLKVELIAIASECKIL